MQCLHSAVSKKDNLIPLRSIQDKNWFHSTFLWHVQLKMIVFVLKCMRYKNNFRKQWKLWKLSFVPGVSDGQKIVSTLLTLTRKDSFKIWKITPLWGFGTGYRSIQPRAGFERNQNISFISFLWLIIARSLWVVSHCCLKLLVTKECTILSFVFHYIKLARSLECFKLTSSKNH